MVSSAHLKSDSDAEVAVDSTHHSLAIAGFEGTDIGIRIGAAHSEEEDAIMGQGVGPARVEAKVPVATVAMSAAFTSIGRRDDTNERRGTDDFLQHVVSPEINGGF
jgi:hypothetical protein